MEIGKTDGFPSFTFRLLACPTALKYVAQAEKKKLINKLKPTIPF